MKKIFLIPRIVPSIKTADIVEMMLNLFNKMPKEKWKAIVNDFEREFSKYFDAKGAVCVSKARMAFYYLLRNLNLKKGGEVLISALHIADYLNMIILAGFKPVVVDLKKNTYNIDYVDLENKINNNSVLLLVTHLSGYATDMERIDEISRKYNVPYIQDCSQAISVYQNRKMMGRLGKAAILSLSLLKPVSTMFGGIIISDDKNLLQKIRSEVDILPPPRKIPLFKEAVKNIILKIMVKRPIFDFLFYTAIRISLKNEDYFSKYQRSNKTIIKRDKIPDDFMVAFSWQQAVLGMRQLETLEIREKERIKKGKYLYDLIRSEPSLKIPESIPGMENGFWLFPVIVENPMHFRKFMAKRGVDTATLLLSLLSEEDEFKSFNFTSPNAKWQKKHTVFIPMYEKIRYNQLDYISEVIKAYQKKENKLAHDK
jgi:dTDP-4-amino-4,6-dideoxygalactose transaminase